MLADCVYRVAKINKSKFFKCVNEQVQHPVIIENYFKNKGVFPRMS